MTYTTDQVVQMAKEVGAEEDWGSVFQMNRKDLTALCNAVRKQTLLEAADEFQSAMYPVQTNTSIVITLRRMAGA